MKQKRTRRHTSYKLKLNAAIIVLTLAAVALLFYGVTTQIFAARDTTPPTITILSPSDNSTISGSVPVEVAVQDKGNVTQVTMYIDGGSSIGTFGQPPFNASWDTTTYIDGTHWIWVTAYDNSGNRGITQRKVTVANNPNAPVVSFSNLTECQQVGGVVNFEANVTATVGQITSVSFYPIAGSPTNFVDTVAPYSALWDSTLSYKGSTDRALVVATDTFGNKAQHSLFLIYNNLGKRRLPSYVVCPPTEMR